MTLLRGVAVVVLLAFAHAAGAADAAPSPGPAGSSPAGVPSGPPPLGDGAVVPKTGLEPLAPGAAATDGAAVSPGPTGAAVPAGDAAGGPATLQAPDATPGPLPPGSAAIGSSATSTATWPMSLRVGGGLLLLAGAGWAWTRLRARAIPVGAASWVRLPEAGLFGPGTPSLSDGWVRCAVDPAERDAALEGVLGTLADHRPVLVIARSDVPVPPVRGHAVHRSAVARPTHVAQVLEALEARGEPSVLLLVEDDPAVAQALAEALPADTAAMVLHAGDPSPAAPGWPVVSLRRGEHGWTARAGETTVPLVAGLDGFRPRGA
ncbi:MAG: hypothetical protein RLZZ299_1851 [Pseudomonadota bacterium]|jgi:hypothetical protein